MNHHLIEALVFDMDGVLVDTKAEIEAFWSRWAHRYGFTLTPEDMTRQIHGCPTRETLTALFPMLNAAQREEIVRESVELELRMTYQPMPGIQSFLQTLKALPIRLALVTSAHPPKTHTVLQQLGLTQTFEAIVTADLVEKGKPDPACYRLAAQQLGIPPQKCVVFEDAVPGAAAALGAGMSVIGVNTPDKAPRLRQTGVSTVIEDFARPNLLQRNGADWQLCPPDVIYTLLTTQPIHS